MREQDPSCFCDCQFNDLKLYLFIPLMTSNDVICVSEFVLFNNAVIFVPLFGKTAKLLLSSRTGSKKQRQ